MSVARAPADLRSLTEVVLEGQEAARTPNLRCVTWKMCRLQS